jgi:hypothetical protein
MINNFNDKFFRAIVESEFLFKDSTYKQKSFQQIGSNSTLFYISDIFSLAKELKQIIRVLDFLSSKAPKSHLYLLINNKPQYYLLNRYLMNSKKKTTKITILKSYFFNKNINSSYTKMLISFMDFNPIIVNRTALAHNFLLLGLIYFSRRLLKNGFFYRVNSKLDNNKKLFFIMSLLEHVLNNYKTK